MDSLPFSQAAANNSEPILDQLRHLFADCRSVLELGAGTGQHAVHFARELSHLRWRPTEHPDALRTLTPRCQAADLDNLAPPEALDIERRPWAIAWPDALYTANTLHIIATSLTEALFAACANEATPGSRLVVYGPFNYDGSYTAPSNASFDEWLKARDRRSGIRDFEWVDALATDAGYRLVEDIAMPANNRLICWEMMAINVEGRA